MRKRHSESKMIEKPSAIMADAPGSIYLSNATSSDNQSKSRLRVKITRWHALARWTWNASDGEVCGICQGSFEGCAPGVKYPGDESPVVWGKCGHPFHLQCVSTWLESGNSTCPFCRSEWEFKADPPVDESRILS